MIINLFFIYYILGLILILVDINIPNWYITILIYFTFKWLFNYRKCTISYFECIIRGVKKEDGIIYNILEKCIDIRYTKYINLFYILNIIIFIDFFYIKGNTLNI